MPIIRINSSKYGSISISFGKVRDLPVRFHSTMYNGSGTPVSIDIFDSFTRYPRKSSHLRGKTPNFPERREKRPIHGWIKLTRPARTCSDLAHHSLSFNIISTCGLTEPSQSGHITTFWLPVTTQLHGAVNRSPPPPPLDLRLQPIQQ